MLRFLTDENFNADIIAAAIRRHPHLDLASVHDEGHDACMTTLRGSPSF